MKILNKIITLIIIAAATQSALADRSNINYCGSTSRSGASLYSGGGGGLTESNTCSPDNNTKALFVTRTGTVSGNGASWLAYLNAGGVIVTEYRSATRVYNEIYGKSILTLAILGNCGDNAMPAVKLNPTDPFWVSNAGLVETATGAQGCGNDITPIVTADPAVTPLGGFSGGGIQLARKFQGSGVLFLLEADWQDPEPSYTPSSKSLMGAMINAGSPPKPSVAVPVPTMSEWAIIILASLMAILAIGRLRRQ